MAWALEALARADARTMTSIAVTEKKHEESLTISFDYLLRPPQNTNLIKRCVLVPNNSIFGFVKKLTDFIFVPFKVCSSKNTSLTS